MLKKRVSGRSRGSRRPEPPPIIPAEPRNAALGRPSGRCEFRSAAPLPALRRGGCTLQALLPTVEQSAVASLRNRSGGLRESKRSFEQRFSGISPSNPSTQTTGAPPSPNWHWSGDDFELASRPAAGVAT